eukprot:4970560-Pyramimonas_sp.AAC.1
MSEDSHHLRSHASTTSLDTPSLRVHHEYLDAIRHGCSKERVVMFDNVRAQHDRAVHLSRHPAVPALVETACQSCFMYCRLLHQTPSLSCNSQDMRQNSFRRSFGDSILN